MHNNFSPTLQMFNKNSQYLIHDNLTFMFLNKLVNTYSTIYNHLLSDPKQ